MLNPAPITQEGPTFDRHDTTDQLVTPAPASRSSLIHLILLTVADFIVRTAYQMGKTPLLPLFAASLGAGEVYLGLISSVSTFTGMIFKPLVGLLSDRQGRRYWLFLGTGFFIGMPFLYRFIETPEQLVAIRLIHGLATAIYGPVTVAMVVELSKSNRAGRVGVFSLGRTGGYIVGPALAGFFLLSMTPVAVFQIIGLMSVLALIPSLFLPETNHTVRAKRQRPNLVRQFIAGFHNASRTSAVWIAGGFEAVNYMVTYTAKAFLPIYALSVGRNTLEAGVFFTVQQGVAMVAKPLFGWVSDRWSHVYTIALAMVGLSFALLMLTLSAYVWVFFGAAVLLGLAEALIIPASTALLANQIGEGETATGLGFLGTLQNGSKILGPIVAGVLIALTSYMLTFQLMAAFIAGAGALLVTCRLRGWIQET